MVSDEQQDVTDPEGFYVVFEYISSFCLSQQMLSSDKARLTNIVHL
jgi:hypothetical protein